MAKQNMERNNKFQRILNQNRNTVSNPRPNRFYALVDIRGDKGTSTVVVSGTSRIDAENNALTEIEVNGWKAQISAIYPISA